MEGQIVSREGNREILVKHIYQEFTYCVHGEPSQEVVHMHLLACQIN